MSNAVAAYAFDDRFPHLFAAAPAQVEQTETASEPVPIPRQAPHRAKAKNVAIPAASIEATSNSEMPVLAAEAAVSAPVAPPPILTPSSVRIQFVAVVPEKPEPPLSTSSALPSEIVTQRAQGHIAAVAPVSPMAFAARPEIYGQGLAPTLRVSSFAERFTFTVSVEPEPLAAREKTQEVTAADNVPVPRPAPKRIRTSPISGAALPFSPIPGDLSAMIEAKAKANGVPLALAHAVVHVESRYNPKVTGKGGTHGLMQIKHATARGMGFQGTVRELYDPETNLEWGMRYLGGAHKLAKGDVCGTVMRYQGGLRAQRMSDVAVKYCGKVRALLARRATPAQATEVARARPANSGPVVAQVSLPAPPPLTSQAALSFQ